MADVRELRGSPSMVGLFARAGVALMPGASLLGLVGPARGGSAEVPDLTLSLADAGIDRDRLFAYDRVCGYPLGDTLPACFIHMLAFPLHLALMTDSSFPFPAIGLVHIANRIVQHRPVGADEDLSIRVWATAIEPHPRGRQFSIHSEVRIGDEVVWEESATNLKRGDGSDGARSSGGDARSTGGPAPSATWRLPGDLGRRYGTVAGDLNPIHVHPLTARLFGFRAAIAHGMWTKARCLAALGPRLPDAFTVQVAFRKPVLLPAKVTFGEAPDAGGGIRFEVRGASNGALHLEGAVDPVR